VYVVLFASIGLINFTNSSILSFFARALHAQATIPYEPGTNAKIIHPAISSDFVLLKRSKDLSCNGKNHTSNEYSQDKQRWDSIRIPLNVFIEAFCPNGTCYGCKRSIASADFLQTKEHEKLCSILDVIDIFSTSKIFTGKSKCSDTITSDSTTPSLARSVQKLKHRRIKKEKLIPEKSSAVKRSARLPKHFTPAQKRHTIKMMVKDVNRSVLKKIKAFGISQMKDSHLPTVVDPLLALPDVIDPFARFVDVMKDCSVPDISD